MRILHIINSLITGGAETIVCNSVRCYRERNLDVEVLLLNGMDSPLLKDLKKQGASVHSLGRGNIKNIYNPLLVFKIIPFLKNHDIIHAHLFPTIYWTALAKWLSRNDVRLVYTEHTTHNKRRGKKIWKIPERLIYGLCDRIVSISRETDIAIKNHLPTINKNRFRIIPNGINLKPYRAAKTTALCPDRTKFTLIQVSAFRKAKDQATVIRALQFLPSTVHLQLVGDGKNQAVCEKLAAELHLINRVSFLGMRTDIPQLLQMSDVAILSSHWEGFGLVAIEGMAAGKPFIASDVPGLREVVEDAGVIFPCGDAKQLAEEIKKLLADPEYYKQVASRCLERAKQYNIENMADSYVALYEDLLR